MKAKQCGSGASLRSPCRRLGDTDRPHVPRRSAEVLQGAAKDRGVIDTPYKDFRGRGITDTPYKDFGGRGVIDTPYNDFGGQGVIDTSYKDFGGPRTGRELP